MQLQISRLQVVSGIKRRQKKAERMKRVASRILKIANEHGKTPREIRYGPVSELSEGGSSDQRIAVGLSGILTGDERKQDLRQLFCSSLLEVKY